MPWRRLLVCLVTLMLLGACPAPAWAFIPHWDPREAFFIRQFSYLFFLLAMLFFIYELRQEKLGEHPGFRRLAWAAVFFALWNLDCFIGQFLALILNPQDTGGGGLLSAALIMAGPATWVYYVSKMDHLLLVPAFICFYLGLRAFNREEEIYGP